MYIGIDLGGTNISAGLVDDNGKLIYPVKMPTKSERGIEPIIDDMVSIINKITEYQKNNSIDSIKGVGIGVPGLTSPDLTEIHYCTNLNWENVPLKELIEKQIDYPVFLDNDANLATLAEYESGALKNVENGVLLTLGTGIGGGLIFNNKPYRGSHGLGELGHSIIGENFYKCNCGKNGCFETFASATAIKKYTVKLIEEKKYPESKLYKNYENGRLGAKHIIDAAKNNDPLGVDAFERYVKYLSIGISNLINTIDPDVIALGGGVAHAGEFLFSAINEKLKEYLFFDDFPRAEIVPAQMGNDAGIVGAGFLAKLETN